MKTYALYQPNYFRYERQVLSLELIFFLSLSIFILLGICARAQTSGAIPRAISGIITDESDNPIFGVNVKVKGSNLGTSSTENGGFIIIIPNPGQQVLQFSYLGYLTKELAISSLRNPVRIKLNPSSNDLDQVQILAYGTTSKRYNIGNSFTLNEKEIAKSPVPNVLQSIQNKVPGLQIIQNTGQIGGSFNVKIRGLNGIDKVVDPLYIVDGVPFPAGGTNLNPNRQSGGLPVLANNGPSATSAQLGGNALNYINPEDIESIDVLKDAEATSIYGSRGAYGVILITTKKGSMRNGKSSFSLNLDRSLSRLSSFPDLLSTENYLLLRKEALRNDGLQIGPADLDLNGTYSSSSYSDWSKEVAGDNAWSTRIHARYSGGGELSSFSISGNFNDQGNVLKSNGYNRDGGMKIDLSTNSKNQKMNMTFGALFNSTVNTMPPYDFSGREAVLRAPNAPAYFDLNGNSQWINNLNPYSYLHVDYRSVTNNLIGSTTISYRPIKGLTIKAILGYNLLTGNELRQTPSTVFSPNDLTASAKANSASNLYNIRTWSFEPYASYSAKLGSKGVATLVAGATMQDKMIHQDQILGTGYAADARLNNPAVGNSVLSNYNKVYTRYIGYFANLNYNWDGKYLISLTSRYDGSTKFGYGNRFGWFGSLGAGYIFSAEKWVTENLPVISFGKLRGSYGSTGGDGIDNYLYLATYSTAQAYLGNTAFQINALGDDRLHWELNKKLDMGISLGFWKDKLTIDANYYRNKISDQLLAQPIASTTGFGAITTNSISKIENSGYEFAISSNNLQTKNFNWSTRLVLTLPRSKVLSLPDSYLLPNNNYVLGLPISNFRVFDYAGIDPQTGNYAFINAAGKKDSFLGQLNDNDRTVNVDLSPKFYGSISNTLSYKTFALDFTFSFVNKMGRNFQGQLTTLPGFFNSNTTSWALGRWQKPGDLTDVPKATTNLLSNLLGQNNFSRSSGAFERIIYAKLQNITLSYGFPKKMLSRINVSNLRLTLQGQNLLTISRYKDLDPENMALFSLPPLRVFSAGINVTL
ncbi:SusC/RagA family TonB-linked outer membrane protein [Pedobacter sp.]|uniref:SusC/RagA family TonB-linked outer membrane protein n=1 Tax=Pedobacter sp. TaxID=1411316 RepID=UPI003C484CA4